MFFSPKKLFFIILFNFTIFTVLLIGIQNSSNKNKVNFLLNETIELPVSFIMGLSFIGGSIFGSFLSLNSFSKK